LNATEFDISRPLALARMLGVCCLCLASGCSDNNREPVTFSCSPQIRDDDGAQLNGIFHFEAGYLFVRDDTGGADNVCSRTGTLACKVEITDHLLMLRQTVALPGCSWRRSALTTLTVDLNSGDFGLVQENCDPSNDVFTEGTCEIL